MPKMAAMTPSTPVAPEMCMGTAAPEELEELPPPELVPEPEIPCGFDCPPLQ